MESLKSWAIVSGWVLAVLGGYFVGRSNAETEIKTMFKRTPKAAPPAPKPRLPR